MVHKLLLIIVFLALHANAFSQTQEKKKIKWGDSVSIKDYIEKSTLCEKLDLVIDSVHIFVKETGYSWRILQSIQSETHEPVYVPIANRYFNYIDEQREHLWIDLMMEIRDHHCKNRFLSHHAGVSSLTSPNSGPSASLGLPPTLTFLVFLLIIS